MLEVVACFEQDSGEWFYAASGRCRLDWGIMQMSDTVSIVLEDYKPPGTFEEYFVNMLVGDKSVVWETQIEFI